LGVIPGGQSFAIPQSQISDVANQGTGFSWTPSVRGGTTLIVVAGDNRSPGNGGSFSTLVSTGTDPSASCLNNTSPSSTPGSPAGGSYATSSSGAGTGGGGKSGGSSTYVFSSLSFPENSVCISSNSNVGAIVGGTLGGVVALAAFALFMVFLRNRDRFHKAEKSQAVDLLNEDEDDERPTRNNELPASYRPEPFIVPDLTSDSSTGRQTLSHNDNRPMSMSMSTITTTDPLFVGPNDTARSSVTRKSAAGPRALRPVNIVQHDDAGPSEVDAEDAEPETVELPPAYTNIRKPVQTIQQ
jgi:hypothetical protein